MNCEATTQKGTICKIKAVMGAKFCKRHSNKQDAEKKKTNAEEKKTNVEEKKIEKKIEKKYNVDVELLKEHIIDCCICLAEIDGRCISLFCGHSFHTKCINEWLDIYKESCPACRSKVTDVPSWRGDGLSIAYFKLMKSMIYTTSPPPPEEDTFSERVVEVNTYKNNIHKCFTLSGECSSLAKNITLVRKLEVDINNIESFTDEDKIVTLSGIKQNIEAKEKELYKLQSEMETLMYEYVDDSDSVADSVADSV